MIFKTLQYQDMSMINIVRETKVRSTDQKATTGKSKHLSVDSQSPTESGRKCLYFPYQGVANQNNPLLAPELDKMLLPSVSADRCKLLPTTLNRGSTKTYKIVIIPWL